MSEYIEREAAAAFAENCGAYSGIIGLGLAYGLVLLKDWMDSHE